MLENIDTIESMTQSDVVIERELQWDYCRRRWPNMADCRQSSARKTHSQGILKLSTTKKMSESGKHGLSGESSSQKLPGTFPISCTAFIFKLDLHAIFKHN